MLIDPSFSIYESIEKNHPSNIFLTTVDHMYLFSRVIEQEIINHRSCSPIYVGIQHFVNLAPILDTYTEIAKFAEIVYLFGMVDSNLPVYPSLNFIPIQPGSLLAREWFILVNQPNYSKVLSAREITPQTDEPGKRQFEAVITSDPKTAQHAISALSIQLASARRVSMFK